MLGGSSAINGQAFVANSKAAVNAWGEFGNSGWDWDTLAPYYKKFYTLTRPSPAACDHLRLSYIDDEVRGTHGPVQASFPEGVEDPLPTAWVDTLASLGYSASSDPFSGEMVGGYINAMSIDPVTKTRSDAVTAYLEPAKTRKNLHVVTGATVEKLVFDVTGTTPKVIGVEVRKDGNITTVKPVKEVILAAGVFGTPKLLELSGIGSRERLEPLGITVVVDNPNVGENLQDHPNTSISFEVADGVKTMDALSRQEPEALGAAMQEYDTKRTGPFASGGNFAGSLLPLPDFEGPEGQEKLKEVLSATGVDATPGPFSSYHSSFVHRVLGDPTEGIGNLFTYASCSNVIPEGAGADIIHHGAQGTPGNFLTICAALLYPLSRGTVHITSADPAVKPTIDPRYLEHPLDLEVIARFLQYIEKIAHTEPLSKYMKPDGRRNHGAPMELGDLDTAKEYVKKSGLSCWHPTSSCAMLPRDRGGVVSPELFVYGVEGLRIVDSSVIPLATRGNCQTTVYAVAERAADLIKDAHGICV
ncbi:glucose-methanol-choline oxidoreductase-like protein [Hypoxylon rubiginosum]|uniref:Glucose-methanol-choline oxidoreductase-like protein n=1 Tax=Hypoxylon rubiginosum TaxID=110542 RepID=A0ACB9YKE5_9PEZI|nr:glucose-methanol-choline oxidoreductase-like protein [Hypoxylon rubiginosum]